MHEIQKKLLELSQKKNIARMSYRKIGDEIDVKHPQKVKHHLEQLHKKGILMLDKTSEIQKVTKRGDKTRGLINFPIFGAANCGEATMVAEEMLEGYLKISDKLLKSSTVRNRKRIFALRVEGDSMNQAKTPINEGDFVLIDPEDSSPNNGDYILSIIDGLANIKRFAQEGDKIVLLSESTRYYPPILISHEDNYLINGKVVEVIKTPQYKKEII